MAQPVIRCTRKADPSANHYAGYHSFVPSGRPTPPSAVGTGSFEVFWMPDPEDVRTWNGPGWYWWACFPGCLPDGEPNGPYRTSYLAYVDARGEA